MHYNEIRKGMKVDFHVDRMGRVMKNCTVTHEPWMQYNTWVCKIEEWDRCVECAQLTPVKR